MNNMMKRIGVHCSFEQRSIGGMDLEQGKHKVTAELFIKTFKPETEEYRLKNVHECQDGKVAICPRCSNPLELKGTHVKTPDEFKTTRDGVPIISREQARENAKKIAESMGEPIIKHIESKREDNMVTLGLGNLTIEVT